MVMHPCNPSLSGGRGRQLTSLSNVARFCLAGDEEEGEGGGGRRREKRKREGKEREKTNRIRAG